jgi:hypothetical protein
MEKRQPVKGTLETLKRLGIDAIEGTDELIDACYSMIKEFIDRSSLWRRR